MGKGVRTTIVIGVPSGKVIEESRNRKLFLGWMKSIYEGPGCYRVQ